MMDHSYCRVSPQQTECDSRSRIKKEFGLLGMEARSPVVSENLLAEGNENVHITTNFIDLEARFLKNLNGKNSSPYLKQNFKISVLYSLRSRLQKEGVSMEAAKLIIKSKKLNSNSNYDFTWGKLVSWCAERKIDTFCSNINRRLEFLFQLFQNGLQYRTINNYRSAIFAFHDHI